MKLNLLDWIAMILVIIGSVNWGLIGLFDFDIVATLFGDMALSLSRIIYSLVGLAGLYNIYLLAKMNSQ